MGLTSLKQQIRELFEHWRKNIEGNDAIFKSVRYRVFRLLDGYDIHPKGERVCIPTKQLEELKEWMYDNSSDFKGMFAIPIKKLLEESKKKEQP